MRERRDSRAEFSQHVELREQQLLVKRGSLAVHANLIEDAIGDPGLGNASSAQVKRAVLAVESGSLAAVMRTAGPARPKRRGGLEVHVTGLVKVNVVFRWTT